MVPICCVVCMLSHVQLFGSPWTVACQAPLSLRFSRQEYRSRLSFPTCISCVSCIGKWIPYHCASIAILINCPKFPLIIVWFFFCLSKLILKHWKKYNFCNIIYRLKRPSLGFTSTGHWKSQWFFSVIFFKNKNIKGSVNKRSYFVSLSKWLMSHPHHALT